MSGVYGLLVGGCCLLSSGCESPSPHGQKHVGPAYDRPFALGQVSDSHWETQQTNAEASDLIFYDHEFQGNTVKLTPAAKKHLMAVAMRLPHVPFPVVVEESPDNRNPRLDLQRRQAVIDELTKLGVPAIDTRVVVAPAIAPGLSAVEGEAAYYSTLQGDFGVGGGTGRRFGGRGGTYR